MLFRQTIAYCESSERFYPGAFARQLVTLWTDVSVTLQRIGEHDQAITALDQALAAGAATASPQDFAWTLVQRGNALDMSERAAEAIQDYDKAISLFETLPDHNHLPEYSSALFNLAVTLSKSGNPQRAVELYDRVVDIREADVKEKPNWNASHHLARACLNRSIALRRLKRFEDAEASSEKALNIWKRLVEVEGHVDLGPYQYQALMEVGCAGAGLDVD